MKVNEGVTEYFTEQVTGKKRPGHYDAEKKVAAALAKQVGDETLRKAYFGGDADAITKVEEALKPPKKGKP